MASKNTYERFVCKKCGITFATEQEADKHIVETASYSSLEHTTRFHRITGLDDVDDKDYV